MGRTLDVFPARLEGLGDAPLDKVRVHAVNGRLRVFKTGAGRKVEKLLDTSVESVERDGATRRSPFTAILADGTTLTFKGEGSCGCGDPLRRFRIDDDS